jgi:alpha-mannosidase
MAAYQLALGSPPGQNLGVDFIWRASDGSTTLAHFMQAGYFQGQNITGSGAVQQIQTCYSTNGPSSTTPYIYVPVMNDFKLPVPDLLQSANAWNQQKYPTNGVWAVEATFDHYVQFIAFYQNQLLTRAYTANPASNILPFQSTPYWTGFYGSRPQLKRMHQRATRALLGAEVFTSISNLLIGPDDTLQPAIDLGWLNLTPSTHHDFVTGTSANLVYQTEQITLLRNALMNGRTTRSLAMQRIASMILSDNGSQIGVVVFNQLGYERGGLVSMQPLSGFTPVSVATAQGATLGPVQIADDGRWLFSIPPAQATVPSLGYSTFMLKNSGTTPATPLACTVSSDGQTITLTNGILTAVLAGDESWGIVSITDATGNEMLSSSPPAVANVPLFYQDNGDPYKFGNETGTTFQQSSATFTTGTVTLDEGDVMITVTITGSFTIAGVTAPEEFTRVYSLALGEPFLRMKTTGAAPAGCSVFVEFPLASPVDTIVHGTPYHWDTKPAQPTYNRSHGWTPPIFEATHDFVIGYADGTALGAIYHSSLHAWAVTTGGTLIGCLLRNVLTSFGTVVDGPCDPEPHTADYTIRIPDGIAAPTEGAQLRESLAWTSPLMAEAASAVSGSVPATVPTTFSLASTSDARAIITTAKAGSVPGETTGSLVLRVYQPTNAPLAVTLTTAIGSPPPQARGITAIETAIDTQRQSQLGITTTGGAITFNAVRAITTIAID